MSTYVRMYEYIKNKNGGYTQIIFLIESSWLLNCVWYCIRWRISLNTTTE